MLMNIPDNRKEPRGLCKPPRFHRVVAGLFLGSRRGGQNAGVFSRKPCEHYGTEILTFQRQ